MGADYIDNVRKLLRIDEPTVCTRTHDCVVDNEPCNGYPRVWTDIDAFGKWTDTMWFSGKDEEMGERDLAIMSLGLGGEIAEVVEKIVIAGGKVQELSKKEIRDGTPAREAILKELSDVQFYLVRIAKYFGYKPSDVLKASFYKLTSRKARGTERGSGDER
jgi:NTP pyrophosphatase (non-canonical NTP hydrolase)